MKATATEQAQKFLAACQENGFTFKIKSPTVLAITAEFNPNDRYAFTRFDMSASSVLALAPLRGGSEWGTDGNSVGGYSGLKNGNFVMNKSGEGARFMKALAKLSQ